jgi:hypothetical protein
MKSRGVESKSGTLFVGRLKRLDFKTTVFHIPDVNGLVLRASSDELLADADIEAGNLFAMELTDKVVEK